MTAMETHDESTDDGPGEFVENVEVDIDQAIVKHFSQHLYSSPHKAIEELVVNGYDAGASEVHVYLPGEFTNDSVVVFDNGSSMDQDGLHQLWWVARSPKNEPGARIVGDRDVIGKFGIGKLASYALGRCVAHLAHKNGQYLLVEFDFTGLGLSPDDSVDGPDDSVKGLKVPIGGPDDSTELDVEPLETDSGPDEATTTSSIESAPPNDAIRNQRQRIAVPMRRLDEDEATEWISSFFAGGTIPDETKALLSDADWTFAVVHGLKEMDVSLRAGTLRRVLGNGLPNRPNFAMKVNGDPAVQVMTAKQAVNDLSGSDELLQKQITSDWSRAVDDGLVSGEVTFSPDGTINLPGLGDVKVALRTYDYSLLDGAANDRGRSHGVFVMVRGRLLNEADYQHLIQDPSFGTLYRCQIVIIADGLDRVLLADRERLSVASVETQALVQVEQAAYRVARQLVDQEQAKANLEQLTTSLLPTNHRELWHDPLAAYSASRGDPQKAPTPNESGEVFDRVASGADEPVAGYDSDGGRFTINTSHPFRHEVDQRIGTGKKARQLLRVMDVYAVADVLLEGQLIDMGLDRTKIAEAMAWRDDLFREMSRRFGEAPSELQKRAMEASYTGDREFEIAVRDIFLDMGFDARHVSGAGKEDIFVVAPVGVDHHVFTIDSKGSKDKVTNLTAHVGGVASHRDEAKAEHALIVARDFTGFAKDGRAAVLKECTAVGRVSVVTLEVLFRLHDMMREYFYPLRVVLDLLRPVMVPDGYLKELDEFRKPAEGFDYPAFLEAIWHQQKTTASGETVFYQSIRQGNAGWKSEVDASTMDNQMLMLEWASGGLIRVNSDSKTVTMLQNPEMVLANVSATLAGIGFVHSDD
jgi:hypothetical protein